MLSGQTFTNIFNSCHLDLEHSNPIFVQDTPVYDVQLENQIWLQMDQQFGRYSRNSHIYDAVLDNQVWLQMDQQFGRYSRNSHILIM